MNSSRRLPIQQWIWLIAPVFFVYMSKMTFGCAVDDCGCPDQLTSNDESPVFMQVEDSATLPNALDNWDQILGTIVGKPLAICLDYDGTLSEHVSDPAKAFMDQEMKSALAELAKRYHVSIITGRQIKTIKDFVKGTGKFYFAANHGLDITFGEDPEKDYTVATESRPHLIAVQKELSKLFENIPGCLVENNDLSVSVHYRKVHSKEDRAKIEMTVGEVCHAHQKYIKMIKGNMVWELRPNFAWDKGKALQYILDKKFQDENTVALYIGDDTTDEDAFKVVRALEGVSILVENGSEKPTAAEYVVPSTKDVLEILKRLSDFAAHSD